MGKDKDKKLEWEPERSVMKWYGKEGRWERILGDVVMLLAAVVAVIAVAVTLLMPFL